MLTKPDDRRIPMLSGNGVQGQSLRARVPPTASDPVRRPPCHSSSNAALCGDRDSAGRLQPRIRLTSIDALRLPWLHFLKMDVEGVEAACLLGGLRTLNRTRPIIYLEEHSSRPAASAAARLLVRNLSYSPFMHSYRTLLSRAPKRGKPGRYVESNMLAIPQEKLAALMRAIPPELFQRLRMLRLFANGTLA